MDPITSTSTTSGAGSAAIAPTTQSGTRLTSDFETFLRLLTTQLRYQDPLNPVDSSNFAEQLATFSGVEQQIRANDLLGTLSRQMGLANLAQLSGWVGMDARVIAPVYFDGSPVTIAPEPATLADSAVLVVRDSSGRIVSRETIPARSEEMDWAGLNAEGDPMARGAYAFEIESYQSGTLVATSPVAVYARIVEARSGAAGAVELVLPGGISVDSGKITALRGAN
jgi:flagellar basal-body rod modification protein FlgD